MEQHKKITQETNLKTFDNNGAKTPIDDMIDFLNENKKEGATHFYFKYSDDFDEVSLRICEIRDETEPERIAREEEESKKIELHIQSKKNELLQLEQKAIEVRAELNRFN
jgi:hypothetical protein